MKKLLFIGIIFLLSSCVQDTFTKDPSLKESERIAILEKAKTDTLTIAIVIDEYTYLVKEKKIESKASNDDERVVFIILGFLLGILVAMVVLSSFIK